MDTDRKRQPAFLYICMELLGLSDQLGLWHLLLPLELQILIQHFH